MIKKLLLFFCLLFIAATGFPQWQTIYYPVPTAELGQINSVYFTDFNKGMAAGYTPGINPIIIRTNNNGTSWDTVYTSSDNAPFKKIILTDSVTAFAVGEFNLNPNKGIIARSNNFGTTWDTIIVNDALYSVDFPSYYTGYAAGSNGAIYKTIDAGNNWIKLITGVSNYFKTIHFINDSTGFVLGDSIILKTIDRGNNWTITNINPGYYYFTCSMSFASDSVGYCCFYNSDTTKIFKTTNCGNSWNLYSYHPCDNFITSMFFTDNNTGYISGAFRIEKTIDGGLTWSQQASSPPSWGSFFDDVMDVFFLNKDTGFVIGNYQFYRTVNGGDTVLSVHEGSNKVISLLSFPNPFSFETTIQANINLNSATLSIYNALGQEVKTINNISGKEITLQRDNLPEGIYFIRLVEGDKIIANGKLIVQ
jgi:photosystem II stability/assembly factor-like uncharacterized protein